MGAVPSANSTMCVARAGQATGLRDFWLLLTEESVNDCENCHYFYCFPDRQLGTVPKGEFAVRAGAAPPCVSEARVPPLGASRCALGQGRTDCSAGERAGLAAGLPASASGLECNRQVLSPPRSGLWCLLSPCIFIGV